MLEGLEHLLELQRLDGEISGREEALEALPDRRKRLEESRASAGVRLEEIGAQLQAEEKHQRQVESELQDQEALLVRLEGQQFQVKDNTAYTALLNEMEQAKRKISECETAILEGMEAVEVTRERLSAAQAEDADVQARADREGIAIDEREAKFRGELVELRAERDQVVPLLAVDIHAVYERVASRRRPAMALVSDETCGGCRVGIPAQNNIEILRGERLVTCGNCQRILLPADTPQAGGAS